MDIDNLTPAETRRLNINEFIAGYLHASWDYARETYNAEEMADVMIEVLDAASAAADREQFYNVEGMDQQGRDFLPSIGG